VNGADQVGGLLGRQTAGSDVSKSYATGHVTGTTSNVGGLIGINYGGGVDASYYNSETSGQSDTGKGEPRTTAQMRQGMAYDAAATYVGWFGGTPAWGIGESFHGGYPYLLALPRFTVDAAITGSGSVQWTGEYPPGTSAELGLVPGRGFSISSAEGCSGLLTGDLYTISSLSEDCTVTVVFAKKFPWILFLPNGSR